ncbi:hypothetical protein ACP4OV_018660 [Aristida adscensionis]
MDDSKNTGCHSPLTNLTSSPSLVCRTPFKDLTHITSIGGKMHHKSWTRRKQRQHNSSDIRTQITNATDRKRQRDKERYSKISNDQREERNRKQRESRRKRIMQDMHIADNVRIAMTNDEAIEAMTCNDLADENMTNDVSTIHVSKPMKGRALHANMTPKEKVIKLERRAVQNRERVRRHRERKQNALHRDSIAMVNPLYKFMREE